MALTLGARTRNSLCIAAVLYREALSAIKVDDFGATKGPTGAKGPVHGGRRRKNKQFSQERRSSPLRPPLAASQKELDTAAIQNTIVKWTMFSDILDNMKRIVHTEWSL